MPEEVRKKLGVGAGGEVGWHIVKQFVVVDRHQKMNDPVGFLAGQIRLKVDAVKLVREAREAFG